ncbi:histidine kinase N-terminal 7TM domain-containing protein [Aeromicrobium duanguangcaii]|uniref:Histidine kinase N-terminal 7TM region domain-containing protein n=1 Tax=Aeromicrobium duanguangcaii TaxID=2968086 RepID=A0ABY5KJD7_9ACTN|nr:histidine kinase N-terminal 7TM domain-containing protein [Aeromicrobium duanguangcaii]MCD9154476.1 hypothetical protein [Aeromicrobium duanguangcaii]MCL3838224.1 hypothetical protein [Aeromicrobium duanguangcaii]UUI68468.1 hypothetical protein NP095_14845 [Aeromicrobium duanguangcaii]
MTTAYLVTSALLVLTVAAVRHHRSSVSVPVLIMLLAAAGWNLARADRGAVDPAPSVTVAINVVFVQITAASFYVATRRLVYGRWRMSGWFWALAIGVSTATFIGMLPSVGLTTGEDYYASPVYVVHLAYSFALFGAGILTLSSRQHDPSPHVRRVVSAVQLGALLVLTLQVLYPSLTPLAVAATAMVMVWTTGHVGEWSRSASRAGRLLDSIGVFILVVDRSGRLQDWNGPAASLLRLKGHTARRDLDVAAALGMSMPFLDESTVTLQIEGGELRTSLSVHPVDPLSRTSDRVLMFRPVRSSVESSSFPTVSGALKGHDPATQTLGRKAAVDQLRAAAEEGQRVLRLDIKPRTPRRADEVMFLMARRMEARAAERGWTETEWARLDTWTFVTPILDAHFEAIPAHVVVEDLGVDMVVSFFEPLPDESAADFVRRVSADEYDHNSAQNS